MPADLPLLAFEDAAAWAAWLEEHGAQAPGILLAIARRGAGRRSVTYDEAVEVALCHGWIDGQRRGGDDPATYLQRFTPRGPRSKWSKINRARAEALIASGAMRPAGRREVERARADGRWDAAYDAPSTATVPDDLRAALDASPAAGTAWTTLDGRNRYSILHRIHDAKRPETRARRIARFVAMLERGERLY